MAANDLQSIQKISVVIHPDLPERLDVFAEKLSLFPQGCFVLIQGDDEVLGYAFAHPWWLNDIPKLDDFLFRLPSSPDCLLIHDISVLAPARGHGASRTLVELITELAKNRGIPNLVLVSVYDSHLHWARLGFRLVRNEILAKKLKSYGETARYMIRKLR